MPVRRLRASGGLSTDPTALDQPEALRVADDVLLHRPGLIQPRPGIGDTTGITARTVSRRPRAIAPYAGSAVVQSSDGSLERLSSATPYTTGAEAPEAISAACPFAQSRGSLFIGDVSGVRVLEAIGDTDTRRAGSVTEYRTIHNWGLLRATAGRHVLAPVSACAYRYCWVHIDASGYRQRSAPSSRWAVVNDSASDYAEVIFGRVYLPPGIRVGDRFELYRTTQVTPETADPGDELFLAIDYEITEADIAGGSIGTVYGFNTFEAVLIDNTPDDQLGASLYTNGSQQGILAANEVPPKAAHLAEWSSRMWYGYTTERPAVQIEVKSVFDTAHPETWRDGAHFSGFTGNTVNGQQKILSVSSVAGLKVGQYISASAAPTVALAPIPALAKITQIATGISILDNADIQTSVPADYIELTGIPGPAGVGSAAWRRLTFTSFATTLLSPQKGATAGDTAQNIADALPAGLTAEVGGSLVTITDDRGYAVPVTISEAISGTFAVSYSITIDIEATSSVSGAFLFAHDYIEINGTEFYFSDASTTAATNQLSANGERRLIELNNARGSDSGSDQARKLTAQLQRVVNDYDIFGDEPTGVDVIADDVTQPWLAWTRSRGELGPYAFLVVGKQPTTAVSFSASRPESWLPNAESVSADVEARPARLWWSKPNEPVAVPPVNFVDIGDSRRAILALVPLDDALLVFKEDGIYSVTGSEPWVIDEISTTHRLHAPRCACVLGGVCYAWTDQGVVAVTPGGVAAVVSAPIAAELREIGRLLPLGAAGGKLGFWTEAHARLGLVILAVSSSTTADGSTQWFVYHATTQRWARWVRTDRCAAYDPATDALLVSPNVAAWSVLRERSDEDAATSYHDASLSGISGTLDMDGVTLTIAISAFGALAPAVGDAMRVVLGDGVAWRRVVDVSTASGFRVITLDGPATGGSGLEWRQGYQSAIEWQTQHIPGAGARYEELHTALGPSSSAYLDTWPMDVGARVGESGSLALVTPTVTPGGTSQVVRVGPSREMVRAYHCHPRIAVRTAGALWQLAELALYVSPQSRRVRR